MAAIDKFQNVLATLPNRDREVLKDLIQREWEELLSARSEEARIRLVDAFLTDVHDRMRVTKH
jgi:hypothetical protein